MQKSLLALAFGTLALGVSEYVMMGILPDISTDLSVSIPRAGNLVSSYALGVCVGAPLVVLLARKKPLKTILLGLATLTIIGNLFASLSPNFLTLLMMRFVSGIPHGAFFGVGSIVAEKVAEKGHETEAVSIMVLGITVANLLGVPLGTLVSNVLTWRITFAIVAILGVVEFLLIRSWIPDLEPLPDTGVRGQFAFLKKPSAWLILAVTSLGNCGIFCWYSYVSPLMLETAHFPASWLTTIMVLAGLGMVIGNLLGGRLSDRYTPERVVRMTNVIAAMALVGILVSVYCFGGGTTGTDLGNGIMSTGLGNGIMTTGLGNGIMLKGTILLLTMVGAGCLFCVSSPQQLLILENSRGCELMGGALVQMAFNIGNAVGAACGAIPIDAGLGYNFTTVPGLIFLVPAILLMTVYIRKYPRQ